jgi:hypothetical protein
VKEGGSLSGEFDVVLIGSQTDDEWKGVTMGLGC